MKLSEAKFDKCALTMDDVEDLVVKYSSIMIAYKIFYTNREGSTIATMIHMEYQMVKEGKYFDLCELL